VVVHNLDIGRAGRGPEEADSPLFINADAVLAGTVASKSFEMVSVGNAQIVQTNGGMEQEEFAPHHRHEILRETPRRLAVKDFLGLGA
jgi:hypothetical protein